MLKDNVCRTWYACDEYGDGHAKVTRQTLDQVTRRVVPETIMEYDNKGPEPFTPDEMIMTACMERVAVQLSEQYGLF